jgi:hypothetical protein
MYYLLLSKSTFISNLHVTLILKECEHNELWWKIIKYMFSIHCPSKFNMTPRTDFFSFHLFIGYVCELKKRKELSKFLENASFFLLIGNTMANKWTSPILNGMGYRVVNNLNVECVFFRNNLKFSFSVN